MRAIVIAGGLGTRLRAVTGESPKPLVPLLGKPLMQHILELLKKNGFNQVRAALGYRAEDIIERFGDGSSLGIELSYSTEPFPLGTAGAVLNCRDFWQDDDFLVISGDAACDFDLAALMQHHKAGTAAATLALYHHPEPLSYGLAVTDPKGRICSFIEKPAWPQVVTDLVNTGIYCLSPRAMEQVPPGRPFDFARDLFPLLMAQGEELLGCAMEGYWCDVGSPLSYYRCCTDALEGRLDIVPGKDFMPQQGRSEDPLPSKGAQVLDCPCTHRASTMGLLSGLLLDMGADCSNGLHLGSDSFDLSIRPLASSAALRVSVRSHDRQKARRLADRAAELIQALGREDSFKT